MTGANPLPGDPPPQPNDVSGWLTSCRDEDRDVAMEARERVYVYLERQLLDVARWRAGMDPNNGLSARDLFHDVVLKMFDTNMPYQDRGQLQAAFCTMLYRKAIDHLRRRAHQVVALRNDLAGPESDDSPARRLEVAENLELLDRAVAELERDRPELAGALKARVLVNAEVRFDGAGEAFSRACRERPADRKRTFEEMGELLGCPLSQAYTHYREAVAWLRQRFPGFTARDFQGGGS